MRITALETLPLNAAITVHAGAISWLWVRVHTDAGLIGLGETYPAAATAEAAVHESLAPVLLGQDARDIARLWQRMFQAVSYHGWAGAEMRAISAVDLALVGPGGQSVGPAGVSPARRPHARAHPHLQHVLRPSLRLPHRRGCAGHGPAARRASRR